MKQQKTDLRSRPEQLYDSSDDSTIHSGSPILLDIVSRLIDVQQQIVSIKANQEKFDSEVNSIKKDIISISNTLTTPTVNRDGIAGMNLRGPGVAEQFPHGPRDYIPSPYWPQIFTADPNRRQMFNGMGPLMVYSPSYPYPAPHYPPEMHHQVPPPPNPTAKTPSKNAPVPHKPPPNPQTPPVPDIRNSPPPRPSSSKHNPKVHIVHVPSRSNTSKRFGKRPYRTAQSPKPSSHIIKKARREEEEEDKENDEEEEEEKDEEEGDDEDDDEDDEEDDEEDDDEDDDDDDQEEDDSHIYCSSSADEEYSFGLSKDRKPNQIHTSRKQGHKQASFRPNLSSNEKLNIKGKEKDTGGKRALEQLPLPHSDANKSSVSPLNGDIVHPLEKTTDPCSSKKTGRQTLSSKESLTYGDFFALASTQEPCRSPTIASSSTDTPLANSAIYPINISSPENSPSIDILSPTNDLSPTSYSSGMETDSDSEEFSPQIQEATIKPVHSAIKQEELDLKHKDAASSELHRRESVANEKGIRSNGTWEFDPICKMTKINTRKAQKKKPGSKNLKRPPRAPKGSISPGLSHISGTDSEEEAQYLVIGAKTSDLAHNKISNTTSIIASNTTLNPITHNKTDQHNKDELELELTAEEIQASEGNFLKKETETEKNPLFKLTLRERFER